MKPLNGAQVSVFEQIDARSYSAESAVTTIGCYVHNFNGFSRHFQLNRLTVTSLINRELVVAWDGVNLKATKAGYTAVAEYYLTNARAWDKQHTDGGDGQAELARAEAASWLAKAARA